MLDNTEHLRDKRAVLVRRLEELQITEATLGVSTHPETRIEIEDIQRKIDKIDEGLGPIEPAQPMGDTPEMILIPAGMARLGTYSEDVEYYRRHTWDWFRAWHQQGQYKWEQPFHQVELRAYKIARYPITNRQYHLFVQKTRHIPPKHWRGGIYSEGEDLHPVVGVTWYNARAYCDWLSQEHREHYRLPTEAEWEKAARGVNGFRWPWGMEWDSRLCNSPAGGHDHTTAVNHFGQPGASPYGVIDCAGNVAEWCSTRWGSLWAAPDFAYPYTTQDGRESLDGNDLRVVRGGDFCGSIGNTRCAARMRFKPQKSLPTLGFRCVCDC